MSMDAIIELRNHRLRGILRARPCEIDQPHSSETCQACCAVAAEQFLINAVEAEFKRQVAAQHTTNCSWKLSLGSN